MPLARIITSTPAAATEIAQSLSDSGYIVDIVSPRNVPANAVDLEINLDIDNGLTKQPAKEEFDPVAGQNEYADDLPIQREFVLAPAWRKLTGHIRDRWTAFRPQRVKQQPAKKVTEFPANPTAAVLRQRAVNAQKRNSFAHAESFASRAVANGKSFIARTIERMRSNAALRGSQIRAAMAKLAAKFSARARKSKADVPVLVSPRQVRTHERFPWQQLWPVAVGALAFIFGFEAATYNNSPVTPNAQQDSASVVTPVKGNHRVRSAKILKPTPARVSLAKQNTVTSRRGNLETADDEVVVRHYQYPVKTITAKNPTQGPKRFSDLQ